ncbi:MAG: MtaA/CmuA family methyltransferase [Chloroflexi bacterium]|nr:MtaA/CmuA family methyltransferase [Chloroflexota bacterium]
MTSRELVLNLLGGRPVDRMPCFSGMGSVTVAGMQKCGVKFSQVHFDAEKMAALAATTPEMYGFDSAVVPFDVGVEAELLGARLNPYEDSDELLYPTLRDKAAKSADDLRIPQDLTNQGRVPVVTKAISLLKERIGDRFAVGTYVLGPFTLAGQAMELNDVLKMSAKNPAEMSRILQILTDLIIQLARIYKDAGADYITVREMGASSGMVSPRTFVDTVKPHLVRAIQNMPGPVILHICGKTNSIIEHMAQCGADALSVDHKNDLEATRARIGKGPVLLGNLDGYNVLVLGTPELVRNATRECIDKGISAVWPGCDIWPTAAPENMIALVEAVREYGRSTADK